RTARGGLGPVLRWRAVHPHREGPPAGGGRRVGRQLRRGRLHARRAHGAHPPGGLLQRAGQSREGGRRTGHPGVQRDDGLRRGAHPEGAGALAVSALSEFAGRWFVVKVGGELAADRTRLAGSVGAAVGEFLTAGIRVCIVHGGGPQATELGRRLGLEANIVGGRRVTDPETLEVMKMALAGQVSVDVSAAMRLAEVPALCTTGVSAGLLDAVRRPPTVITGAGPDPVDLGLVGDIVSVDTAALEKLASVV